MKERPGAVKHEPQRNRDTRANRLRYSHLNAG
jgi:hypothetical protein